MSETTPETKTDIINGPLPRVIFYLALPILLENFLAFLVGFYDVILAGRISEHATKAIGITSYVGWLASMLFGLVGTGTTALISRQYGEQKYDDANIFLNRSLALAGVVGVMIAGSFYVLAPQVAGSLNMEGEAYVIAVRYLRFDSIGHLFSGMTFIGAAALRGAGNMRLPMMILGFMNLVNILVSTVLVFGLGSNVGLAEEWISSWGVEGIVAGTVTAKICGSLVMVACLMRGSGSLQWDKSKFGLMDDYVRRILRIGSMAVIDNGIVWVGQFFFLMIISRLDADPTESYVFAAHVIGIRVEAISFLPAFAWGLAASTAVGQSLGAMKPDRARRAGIEALRQCSVFMVFLSLAFYFGAEEIYRWMSDEPKVWTVGVPAFRFLAMFQLPLATAIIFSTSLRGAGDTRSPMVISLIGVTCVRLPVAYYCGVTLGWGLLGAWVGMFSDVSLKAVLFSYRYLRGTWTDLKI